MINRNLRTRRNVKNIEQPEDLHCAFKKEFGIKWVCSINSLQTQKSEINSIDECKKKLEGKKCKRKSNCYLFIILTFSSPFIPKFALHFA